MFTLGRAMHDGLFGLSKNKEAGNAMMLRAGHAAEGEDFYGPAAAYYAKRKHSAPHLRAAAEAGQTEAQLSLGENIAGSGDHVTGLKWVHIAADAGDVWALICLAEISFNGLYGQPRSTTDSFEYAFRASSTEHPAGQTELAMHYVLGAGTAQNQRLGAGMLQDIVNRTGNDEAIYWLAKCMAEGWGVTRNLRDAKALLQNAVRCEKVMDLFRLIDSYQSRSPM